MNCRCPLGWGRAPRLGSRTIPLLVMSLLFISLVVGPVAATARSYTVGVAPAGTAWFEGLSAVFQVVGKHTPHSVVIVETGGTVDNAQRMNRGELDFGFVEMLVADEWHRGTGRFEGQGNDDARLAFVVGSTAMHWAVRSDSDVADLSGLTGRPFNPSTMGGGGERLTELIFGILGIAPDFRRMAINDAVEAVRDGQLVGFSYNGTPPVPLFAELHEQRPLRLLSLTDEQMERVVAELPYLSPRVIPDGSYAGIPEVKTVGILTAIAATRHVPDDVVYEMTRAYWEHHGAVAGAFPAAGEVGPGDVIQGATIPLHAGAVRYYQEMGLDIPEHLIPPEAR